MKYYYLIGNEDQNYKKEEITLKQLTALQAYMAANYFHSFPISFMHVLTHLRKDVKNGIPSTFSYEEGLDILKSLNVDYEQDLKAQVAKFENTSINNKCINCNHPRGWHFAEKKCCDGKCDCEDFAK